MGHTWCILIYIWNLIFRFSNWPDVAYRPCNARVAPADAQGTTSGFKILPKDTSICTVVESLIEQLTLWLVDGSLYLTKHSCDNQQLQLLGQYHINVKKRTREFPSWRIMTWLMLIFFLLSVFQVGPCWDVCECRLKGIAMCPHCCVYRARVRKLMLLKADWMNYEDKSFHWFNYIKSASVIVFDQRLFE